MLQEKEKKEEEKEEGGKGRSKGKGFQFSYNSYRYNNKNMFIASAWKENSIVIPSKVLENIYFLVIIHNTKDLNGWILFW